MSIYFKKETLSLLSSLIGLSRALEGVEEPTEDTISLIFSALSAIESDNPPSSLKEKLIEKKKETVPSCFLCASPCGHNDDYPEEKIDELDNPVTKEVIDLLDKLVESSIDSKSKIKNIIKGIIYISSDFPKEYVDKYTAELRALI